MVKRLNAPLIGALNQSAVERLVRDSTGDILPIDLADADSITGDLPFANLTQGSALSVLGVTGNATADNASIAAGTDGHVLRRSGTALAFGTVATGGIADDAVTYAKMQNVSAASKLLGRGDSGSGDPQEITLGTNLTMSGTTLNGPATYTDPWAYDKLTAAFNTASTTAVSTGLSIAGSAFAINSYYEFEAICGVARESGSLATIRTQLAWPATDVTGAAVLIYGSTMTVLAGTTGATMVGTTTSTTLQPWWIRGYFFTGGTTPTGSLEIQQFTSDAARDAQMGKGSFIKYRQLG